MPPATPKAATQQREFVRVDDILPLAWRLVEESELAEIMAFFEKKRAFPPKQGDDVRQLLNSLDVTGKLKQLERTDPVLAQILGRMDMKLNLLLRLFHPGEEERPLVPTNVNLSGGGIAFMEPTVPAVKEGDVLEVRLALSNDALTSIEAYARVMKLFDVNAEGLTKVACRFEPILDPDRERIIQHIFKRQSELLRAQRGR